MTTSVKGEYALHALFDLVTQESNGPVKIADIARRQKIPQKFLELILSSLKQGGFVESRRGADGGYLLARRSDAFTIGEVLRHIDGARDSGARSRKRIETPFSGMWVQVDRAISAVIDHTTFADLARSWKDKQNKYVPNWDI